MQSGTFLGHIVSSEGIHIDSQKIEAVKQWPRPTSTTDIRSFVSLESYYKRFVDSQKIEAVKQCPKSTSAANIKSFVGLAVITEESWKDFHP